MLFRLEFQSSTSLRQFTMIYTIDVIKAVSLNDKITYFGGHSLLDNRAYIVQLMGPYTSGCIFSKQGANLNRILETSTAVEVDETTSTEIVQGFFAKLRPSRFFNPLYHIRNGHKMKVLDCGEARKEDFARLAS